VAVSVVAAIAQLYLQWVTDDSVADISTFGPTLLLWTLALICAALWAPLPSMSALAAALPIAAAAATWASKHAVDHRVVAAHAFIAASAAAVAIARHRRWLQRARRLIEAQHRIAHLDEQLNRAMRADQEKSRFLAIASHDLRQPVHALGLF